MEAEQEKTYEIWGGVGRGRFRGKKVVCEGVLDSVTRVGNRREE